MSVIDISGKIFSEHLNDEVDKDKIASALTMLFSNENNEIDIMGVISTFHSDGITSLETYWMESEVNGPLSIDQVTEIFGTEKISEFASAIDVDQSTAAEGLAGMIPELIDKASSTESLQKKNGRPDNLVKAAKTFF